MLNKSYGYLVPLLNEHCKIDSDFIILMENTFVYHPEYDEADLFTMMYEKSDVDTFVKYIESLQSNYLFKDILNTNEFVFLTFKFPEEYIIEYNLFKEGKFSLFRDVAKNKILNYILDIHDIKSADALRKVLYKDDDLRSELEGKLGLKIDKSLELSSIPEISKETFIRQKYE